MGKSSSVPGRFLPCVILLICFGSSVSGQVLNLDQVLSKHYEALGGIEAIKSVKSRHLTGRMTIGPGMETLMTVRFKRPMKVRLDFTVQGMVGSQGYDGKTAWSMMTFLGQTSPVELTGQQADNLIRQAEFDGPLIDWKEKQSQLDLLGLAQFEGREAYKIRIAERSGDIVYHYLDSDSFLTIGQESTMVYEEREVGVTSIIGDYREVNGLRLPHTFENRQQGTEQVQKITFDKIELNVEIEDEIFSMP